MNVILNIFNIDLKNIIIILLKNFFYKKKKFILIQMTKEGFNLDPWVQWVSVHTGKLSKNHKIYRLGQN